MIRSGRLPLWNGYAGCGAPHLANGQSAVFDPFHLLAYLGTDAASLCLDRRGPVVDGRARHVSAGTLVGAGLLGTLVRGPGLSVLRLSRRLAAVPGDGRRDLDALAVPGDRPACFDAPGARAAGWLAVVVALVIFGGHIQTSAHVLLAGGLYALARGFWERADARQVAASPRVLGAGNLPRPGIVGRPDPAAGFLSGQELGLERPPERTAAVVGDRSAPAARRGLHGGPLCLWEPAPGPSQSGASASAFTT